MSSSGFPDEKLDALDLIINALKDHEKRLDELSYRLESLLRSLSTELKEVKRDDRQIEPSGIKKGPVVVSSRWTDYKGLCKKTRMAAFEIEDNLFQVYAVINEDIVRYSEELPNKKLMVTEEESYFTIDKDSLNNIDLLQFLINKRLKCGLVLSIRSTRTKLEKGHIFELSYDLDSDVVKEFLARELGISKGSIVEGKITC